METPADIIVVAVAAEGKVDPVAWEMLAFARRLQALSGGRLALWVLGNQVEAPAREIARTGAVDVTALSCPQMPHYFGEACRAVLGPALGAAAPAYVVTAHTSQGSEWAPAVAARLDAGCIGGVDGLGSEDGRIWFSRDCHGGKVKGRFTSRAATTVVTVQPGCFRFEGPPAGAAAGRVTCEAVAWQPEKTRFLGVAQAPAGVDQLTEARIIVAAGSGIREAENLQWIQRLAQRMPKAMVAGSRIVCDRGWLGYDRQVGVTGATVSPALYIACGISGASQHLMGMRGSGFVIAVNTDAQAPICAEADVCIVADLTTFIPMVLELYDKQMETQERS